MVLRSRTNSEEMRLKLYQITINIFISKEIHSFVHSFTPLKLISYELTKASGWAKPWTRLMLGACQSCDSLSWITTLFTSVANDNQKQKPLSVSKYYTQQILQCPSESAVAFLYLYYTDVALSWKLCVMISYFVARNWTWPGLSDLHIVILPPTAVYRDKDRKRCTTLHSFEGQATWSYNTIIKQQSLHGRCRTWYFLYVPNRTTQQFGNWLTIRWPYIYAYLRPEHLGSLSFNVSHNSWFICVQY